MLIFGYLSKNNTGRSAGNNWLETHAYDDASSLASQGDYLHKDQVEESVFLSVFVLLHCALSLAAQCIVIGHVCGFVCVCGSVTTITRNCVHRSSPN